MRGRGSLPVPRWLKRVRPFRRAQPNEGQPPRELRGLVEVFQTRQIVGWVSGEPGAFPVRITLHVNDLEVASTWANDPSSHNTSDELRVFRFAIKDLWRYCQRSDQITIRADNHPLPICGKGDFKRPGRDGAETITALTERFEEGYLFSQTGDLQLSKQLDKEWQHSVLSLYERVSTVVREKHGYDPFVVFGTLLGVVREGNFIGHDVDFDAAYLSRHTNGRMAAQELRDIAFSLIDAGMDVEGRRTTLHIHHEDDPTRRIDLFHLYFDENDNLVVPFGVAGTSEITRESWGYPESADLAGHVVHLPPNPEALVEHLYGQNWRTPIPGFDWEHARVKQDREGWLPADFREEVYWANFYARTDLEGGSTFFDAISRRDDLPWTVVDIGCGDGRDAFAFARAGRQVIGLDRSHVAVRHAAKKALESGLSQTLSFVSGDVSEKRVVEAALERAHMLAGDKPVLLYLRFFLHSIPEETQEALFRSLHEFAKPGDLLAAEFRTDKDRARQKFFGKHYRRYQEAAAFARALEMRWGFTVLEQQESDGLSPYKGEDPVLYRVVARRRG